MGMSIDGYIADRHGKLDFLDIVPNDEQTDMGYYAFMETIDALVMGRTTFETVLGFGIDWPYQKPVFVLSSSITQVPAELDGKVFILSGSLQDVLNEIHAKGYESLYIDGGKTVQNFLAEDLIDEMIITVIPILIGAGVSLFGELPKHMEFELVSSTTHLKHIVQRHYKRKR